MIFTTINKSIIHLTITKKICTKLRVYVPRRILPKMHKENKLCSVVSCRWGAYRGSACKMPCTSEQNALRDIYTLVQDT